MLNPQLKTRGNRGRWAALDRILEQEDIRNAYTCMSKKMENAYKKSAMPVALKYRQWIKVNAESFYAPANDYGWANVFVNDSAKQYKKNKYTSNYIEGSVIAKESFVFNLDGTMEVGPLFYMEKMYDGFNSSSNDWRFIEIEANGITSISSRNDTITKQRCNNCHSKRSASDFLYFNEKKKNRASQMLKHTP